MYKIIERKSEYFGQVFEMWQWAAMDSMYDANIVGVITPFHISQIEKV